MQINLLSIDNLAKEAAELEYTSDTQKNKKEIWVEMGRELEAANYDKAKISTKIRSLIDKHLKEHYKDNQISEKTIKFKSGHFDHIMKVQGWTDPENNNASSVTGQRQSNGSSLNEFKSNCYEERKNDIILLDKFIKLFQALVNELNIEEDDMKVGNTLTTKPRNWKEYYTPEIINLRVDLQNIVANLIEEWNQSLDKRYSLMPKMKLVAPAIVKAIATTSSFCSRHYLILKSKTEIDPKTYKKFMDDVKSYSDYLKILQVDGWKYYALPVPCPECDEYTLRTRLNPDGTWHFVCVNKIAHKEGQPEYPARILKEQIEKTVTNTKEAEKLLKYYGYDEKP